MLDICVFMLNLSHLDQGQLLMDYTAAILSSTLSGLPVDIVAAWQSTDPRPGRQVERWLNVVAVHH